MDTEISVYQDTKGFLLKKETDEKVGRVVDGKPVMFYGNIAVPYTELERGHGYKFYKIGTLEDRARTAGAI